MKAFRLLLIAFSTSADYQARGWRLMRRKRMEDLAAFSVSEESSNREKKERRVFLCRRTVRVEVKSKVIPTSFLKIKGRGRSLGRKTGKRGTAVVQRAARRKNGLCKRSARGNWDLRKANNYFGPTQKGSKTAPSR